MDAKIYIVIIVVPLHNNNVINATLAMISKNSMFLVIAFKFETFRYSFLFDYFYLSKFNFFYNKYYSIYFK